MDGSHDEPSTRRERIATAIFAAIIGHGGLNGQASQARQALAAADAPTDAVDTGTTVTVRCEIGELASVRR